MDYINNKVAIYCRVSTNKIEQKSSIENQKVLFIDTIKRNNEEIFNIYVDDGETGTELENRADFERMLYDAGVDTITITYGNKKIKHFVASNRTPAFYKIYIKSTSRLARNMLIKQIINELTKKNVSIFFLEQNLDSIKDSALTLSIFQMMDENESRDKSEKAKTAVAQSAKNNTVKTTTRIYGYIYYPMNPHARNDYYSNRLVVIPEEAEVIKLIFNLYAEGNGIRKIEKILKEKGILNRDNKPFGKSTIGRILDNEKYCGLNQHLKWTSGYVFNKHYPQKREKYEVEECDRIEAIIDIDLFNECKAIRIKNTENSRGKTTQSSMFSKRIKCEECGANYNADYYDGQRVYRCPTRKFQGTEACTNKPIYERECINFATSEKTEKDITDILYKKIKSIKEYIEENSFVYAMLENENTAQSIEDAQLMAIEEEKNIEVEKLSKVFTLFSSKQIDKTTFDILTQSIKNKIEKLENRKDNLKKDNYHLIQEIEQKNFELDILKKAILKIKKDKEYTVKHIYILVSNKKLKLDAESTIHSILNDI